MWHYPDRYNPIASTTWDMALSALFWSVHRVGSVESKVWSCQLTLTSAALDLRTAGLLARKDAVLMGAAIRDAAMVCCWSA